MKSKLNYLVQYYTVNCIRRMGNRRTSVCFDNTVSNYIQRLFSRDGILITVTETVDQLKNESIVLSQVVTFLTIAYVIYVIIADPQLRSDVWNLLPFTVNIF